MVMVEFYLNLTMRKVYLGFKKFENLDKNKLKNLQLVLRNLEIFNIQSL